jgi:predicted Zn-dependent protease
VAFPTDEALAFFKRLAAREPRNARHLGRAAKTAYELARLDEAFALASSAVALDPGDAWGLYTLALLHQGRFDHAAAAEALERLLAAERPDFDGRVYLTRSYLRLPDPHEAGRAGGRCRLRRACFGRPRRPRAQDVRFLICSGCVVEAQAL